MSNLQVSQTLQDRVGDRIREQIGTLMTDDDIKRLVEAAMQEAFFKEVRIPKTYGPDEVKPSPFVGTIGALLKDRIESAMSGWLAEHDAEVKQIIHDAIGKGMTGIVTSYIDQLLTGKLMDFQRMLESMFVRRT